MKRIAISVFLLAAMFAFYPRAARADNDCHCNQTLTLKGSVIGTQVTPDNKYYVMTNLSCGQGDYVAVNIKGQGNPPSSCKENSAFTVTGTVNCAGVYEIDVIPSKLICKEE
ncbi:MAG: hypothetical protein M0Z75_00420 [Nitrospiraceae bacterium]|nr:hypothetical protein [Nitrospiraceae bacterium]